MVDGQKVWWKQRFVIAEEAVIDMPFRLLIIVIVLAITLPLIIREFSNYLDTQRVYELEREVERIKNTVIQVYAQGLNASLVQKLRFPDRTEYVRLGSSLGDELNFTIRYKLFNSDENILGVVDNLQWIPMSSANNDTFSMAGGEYVVLLSKQLCGYDINGDGLRNDFYVRIESRSL